MKEKGNKVNSLNKAIKLTKTKAHEDNYEIEMIME